MKCNTNKFDPQSSTPRPGWKTRPTIPVKEDYEGPYRSFTKLSDLVGAEGIICLRRQWQDGEKQICRRPELGIWETVNEWPEVEETPDIRAIIYARQYGEIL